MWFSPSALPAGNFFVLMYSGRGSRGNAPCGCRAEPAESLPQGTRRSRFRTLKSKPNGLRYLLPSGNSRRKAIPKPNKQTDRFAPIWVKGGSPLPVQGGARGIIAARHPAQPLPNLKKQAERLELFIAVRQFPP